MNEYEGRSPSVVSAPALGDLEGAPTCEYGTQSGRQTAQVFGARSGYFERHGIRSASVDLHAPPS